MEIFRQMLKKRFNYDNNIHMNLYKYTPERCRDNLILFSNLMNVPER